MRKLKFVALALALAIFLAGCAAGEVVVEEPTPGAAIADSAPVEEPSATELPPVETTAPSTATTVPTDTPAPTATATPAPTATAEPVASACLVCHVDKEMLIETAAPEEPVVEVESSGVG